MIKSFQDKTTLDVFHAINSKEARKFPANLHGIAQRKLYYLDSAIELKDMRQPPGNRLEKLQGDLAEFHSIRINEQWRIVFRWTDDGAENVQIVDYH